MAESTSRNRRRKRQRVDGTTVVVEYPDIPYVPMDVIPCFIEAIRASTKFLKHCPTPFDTIRHDDTNNNNDDSTNDTNDLQPTRRTTHNNINVHDHWMNRVQNAADTETHRQQQEHTERLERRNQAVDIWIHNVKRFARRSDHQSQEEQSSQQSQSEKPSVPYACFLYLWQLQLNSAQNRLPLRRAALSLSAILLQRSKDCRFHLEEGSHLADWISNNLTVNNNNNNNGDWKCLIHEASLLLDSLEQQGYARPHLYPKIGVAALRLRQLRPVISTSATTATRTTTDQTNINNDNINNSNNNMADWRRIRDLALQYGSKEIQRLEKWIAKSHECLEILVPRMGQEYNSNGIATTTATAAVDAATATTTTSTTSMDNPTDNENDDEDNSDIDWEEGDDAALEQDERDLLLRSTFHQQQQNNFHHHLLAVDRTLAVMESTGGLRGGEIEIDMTTTTTTDTTTEGDAQEESNNNNNNKNETTKKARETLKKVVQLLTNRHLPRLSLWLDGLTNADNLELKKNSSSAAAALVLMPSESTKRRQQLLEQLSELKRSVSSILSSAAKLDNTTSTQATAGGGVAAAATATTRPFQATRIIAPGLIAGSGSSNHHTALVGSISRMQKRRRQKRRRNDIRSNRIQIKCKSK